MLMGYEKHELRTHLARGTFTQAKLAEMYGVTPQTIVQFKARYAKRIEDMRKAYEKGIESEFVGLWVAEKSARIAEYQQQIEFVSESLEQSDDPSKLLRLAQSAIKSVAEELGALPNRATIEHNGNVSVSYNIVTGGDGV